MAKKVGAQARVVRERNDLTQRELANRAGMVHQEISRFERGDSDVRLSTLDKLARALGVSVEELVRET